jgi:hypothetical protein
MQSFFRGVWKFHIRRTLTQARIGNSYPLRFNLDGLARSAAILFVSLNVRLNQTDDRSNFSFGFIVQGFDVFNDPKAFPVGFEVVESSHKPQAQEF